jgi:ribosomal protein S18 acetylase RimI-like enzyme
MTSASRIAPSFRRFDPARLPELMTWFPEAEELRIWGGPEFRHPFTPETFREDSKIDSIASWSLVSDDGELAAFGQCYLRIERCHFGRVGVSPHRRGGGLGTRLFREMAAWGLAEFGDRQLSLFVLKGNEAAYRLYLRLGFRVVPYPEPFMPTAHYMIADRLEA